MLCHLEWRGNCSPSSVLRWKQYHDGKLFTCAQGIFPLRQRIVWLEIRSLDVAYSLLCCPWMVFNLFAVRTHFFVLLANARHHLRYLYVIEVVACGSSFKVKLVNVSFSSSFHSMLSSILSYACSHFLPHPVLQIYPRRRPSLEVVCECSIHTQTRTDLFPERRESLSLSLLYISKSRSSDLFRNCSLVRMIPDNFLRWLISLPYVTKLWDFNCVTVTLTGYLTVSEVGNGSLHSYAMEPCVRFPINAMDAWKYAVGPHAHANASYKHCVIPLYRPCQFISPLPDLAKKRSFCLVVTVVRIEQTAVSFPWRYRRFFKIAVLYGYERTMDSLRFEVTFTLKVRLFD